MKRSIALDVGKARTGVAVSDALGSFAQPLGFVPMKGLWVEELKKMVAPYLPLEALVVGLPRHMNGSEGESAAWARSCAQQAGQALDCEPQFVDERLTTSQATRILLEGDVSRAKRKVAVDAMSAALILQTYLDSQRS